MRAPASLCVTDVRKRDLGAHEDTGVSEIVGA